MADRDRGAPTTILATVDPALLGVAQSLLEAAGIPFFLTGYSTAIGSGPPRLQVPLERVEEARALLADLRSSSGR
jgi:hypothetical protein